MRIRSASLWHSSSESCRIHHPTSTASVPTPSCMQLCWACAQTRGPAVAAQQHLVRRTTMRRWIPGSNNSFLHMFSSYSMLDYTGECMCINRHIHSIHRYTHTCTHTCINININLILIYIYIHIVVLGMHFWYHLCVCLDKVRAQPFWRTLAKRRETQKDWEARLWPKPRWILASPCTRRGGIFRQPLEQSAGRGERGFAVEKGNSGRDLCWSICCSCNILTFLDLS